MTELARLLQNASDTVNDMLAAVESLEVAQCSGEVREFPELAPVEHAARLLQTSDLGELRRVTRALGITVPCVERM